MIKQFHPYGFAVCSNEKENDFEFIFGCLRDGLLELNLQMDERELVLIADGAEAISNAFLKVFGIEHNIVMCCFHMRKNIEKRLYLVEDKALHHEIINDIQTLQLFKNKKVFDIATRLCLKKWKNEEKFLQFFSNEWLDSKNGWYEGLGMYVPSTNPRSKKTISKRSYTIQIRPFYVPYFPRLTGAPRSINLYRTRPFSHDLRPFGMHRITVVLHRAINDRIRSDTEISDHITAVSNRLRQGK
ncbi:unnamed protein product [Rotaria magnacalcarata]|uniref:MULE transposase domain-containing protein n=2 Tax=Rotaria magnacalcarata TaxID=392030 RepID=A0A815C6B9_9BILA|nr:unnamed protein product [Rotaria magnacalcarata]